MTSYPCGGSSRQHLRVVQLVSTRTELASLQLNLAPKLNPHHGRVTLTSWGGSYQNLAGFNSVKIGHFLTLYNPTILPPPQGVPKHHCVFDVEQRFISQELH